MSFVFNSSFRSNRALFGPILMLAMITALVLVPHASASGSVRINGLLHYGVPGLTTSKAGSQSQGATKNGWKPSKKVGKFVRVKSGVKLRPRKGEKIVNAWYDYVNQNTNEPSQEVWNGKGVLPLTTTITVNGESIPIKVTDVIAWAFVPHQPPYVKVPLK